MGWTGVFTIIAATALIGSLISFSTPEKAYACGAEPFLGEICWFGFNFAPRGYALCDGQLLPISQNTALFALLGTIYGGDGRVTFGLPDMRGRSPIHFGQGPQLSSYEIGQMDGTESVTLTINNLPSHTHGVTASTGLGDFNSPDGKYLSRSWPRIYDNLPLQPGESTSMGAGMIQPTGGDQSFDNRDPHLTVNCSIALQGIFPSQN